MSISITFLGAARTVTGSKYLIEAAGRRLLIDCGAFQGPRELRRKNWEECPVPLTDIDAVLLTHAHIDHTGLLPRYYTGGLRCPVYATAPTKDLCGILLPDMGRLQEQEARYRAERKRSWSRLSAGSYDPRYSKLAVVVLQSGPS